LDLSEDFLAATLDVDIELGQYLGGNALSFAEEAEEGADGAEVAVHLGAAGEAQDGDVLALFGAPDVVVDPYTLAATGQVRITLNQYADFGIRQPAAFVKIDDVLTT
jgi:hypothetical protein